MMRPTHTQGTGTRQFGTAASARVRRVLRDVDTVLPTLGGVALKPQRAIDGRGGGMHRARGLGAGSESSDGRSYVPGDDPRRIDWNATARCGEIIVRDTDAERALRVVTVIDSSRSMFHGTTHATKHEHAVGVTAFVARLVSRQGDLVGGYYAGERPLWLPGGGGNTHVWANIRAAMAMEPSSRPFSDVLGRTANLIGPRRSVVVLVSDFHEGTGLVRAMRKLSSLHTVVCVRIEDPLERTMADVGVVSMTGSERGRRAQVDTSDTAVRERYARRATELANTRDAVLRGSGARVGLVQCGPGWARELAAVIRRWS